MDQTGRTLYSISAARVPALAASAPDWESDESEPDGYAVSAASTRECRTGLKARFASGHGSTGVGTRNRLADAVAGVCVVCFDGPQSTVCVPCGHNAICMECGEKIMNSVAQCPVCRAHVRELIKLYRA